jgi:NAD(P)-dependent dehydrogenase (short-subunit alcohol dehydrogenase family)
MSPSDVWSPDPDALRGRVAVVAGATRGAGRGIAAALGEAGATVYCTGRSTRKARSEYDRPETIEETAALVDAAGGRGIAVRVDHLVPDEVRDLGARIDAAQGRLDVVVHDIWGGELLKGGPSEWDRPIWELDLDAGLRILRLAIDTHLITSHHLLPLLVERPGGLVVEVTDGTTDYNADEYRISVYYDLAKVSVNRLAFSQGHDLAPVGGTAVAITPGFLRSEMMLEAFQTTEDNWREFTGPPRLPRVGVAPLRRPCRRRARGRRRPRPLEPALGHLGRAGRRLWLHRRRRLPAAGVALHRRLPRQRRRPRPRRIPLAAVEFGREHEFGGTVAQVASLMSDPTFQTGLDLPDLARPDVVAHEVDGTTHRLTLRYAYVGQLDPIAQKVVGNRALTWVQDLLIDVATGAGTLQFSADGVGGRADGIATVTITATGDASCRRRIAGEFRIRIPLVGGKAERAIVPGLERRLDVEAAAVNRALA